MNHNGLPVGAALTVLAASDIFRNHGFADQTMARMEKNSVLAGEAIGED